MAGFYTETNKKRALKILGIIDLLHKSSITNKAGVPELQEMLQPVIHRLSDLGLDMGSQTVTANVEPEPEVSSPDVPGMKSMTTPTWVDVRQMAEEASLEDLGHAMAIYGTRVSDAVYELSHQKAKKPPKPQKVVVEPPEDVTPTEVDVEENDPWA